MKEYIINEREAKQRLDKYLKRILPGAGSSFLYKMMRKKNIVLNDARAAGNELLQAGDHIKLYFSDDTFEKFHQADSISKIHTKHLCSEYHNAFLQLKGITVLYEDEHIIIMNKPSGILSQKSTKTDLSLNEWMIGYLLQNCSVTEEALQQFKPSVLNRLDRNTSGIVLGGKTLPGSQILSKLLKTRNLKKYYHALVYGKMEIGVTKHVCAYLKKDTTTNKAAVILKLNESDDFSDYDKIENIYTVLDSNQKYSYLEVELITGKTHQIRAHMSALQHPLIADEKYADKSAAVRNKELMAALKLPDSYQFLHAYSITFPKMEEPLSKLSNITFTCKESESFEKMKAFLFSNKG